MSESFSGTPAIVIEVSELPAGAALSAPTAVGVTALPVDDTYDFNPDGGDVTIESVILSYSSIDLDNSALNLTAATTVTYDESQPVLVYPPATERWALIKTDDDDDAFRARIPHSLQDRFPTGIREDVDRENVSVRVYGETWVVEDMLGVPGIITGSLIRTAEEGQRWEIGSTTQWYGDYRSIKAFSGRTDETSPAEIFGRGTGIGIKSTAFTNTPPAEFGVANREFEAGPLLYMGIISMYAGSLDLIASDGPAEDGSKFGSQVRIEAGPDSDFYQGFSSVIARSNGLDDKAGVDVFSNGKIKINSYTIGGSGNDASIDIFMGGDPEFAGTPTSRIFLDDDDVILSVGTNVVNIDDTQMLATIEGNTLLIDADEITLTRGAGIAKVSSTGLDVQGGDLKVGGTTVSRALVARTERTTNTGTLGTTAGTAVNALSVTTPVIAGRRYKFSWSGHVSSTVATATAPDRVYIVLVVDGVEIFYQHVPIFIANMAFPTSFSYDWVATATGNVTSIIRGWDTNSAAGNCVVLATASLKAVLLVEDAGV